MSARSNGSNISKLSKKSAKSKVSKKSKSPAASKSASKHASYEDHSNIKNSNVGGGAHSYRHSVAGSKIDLQDPQRDVIIAHPKLNELPQDQVYPPVGANITDF